MAWGDIAMIVFACTTANHLGLIEAVERTIRHRLPIIDCCKCCSFWVVMGYCVVNGLGGGIILSVAISFLAAYAAVWLELLLGFIDTIYNKVYGWIYDEAAIAAMVGGKNSADATDADDSEYTVSEVRLSEKDFE